VGVCSPRPPGGPWARCILSRTTLAPREMGVTLYCLPQGFQEDPVPCFGPCRAWSVRVGSRILTFTLSSALLSIQYQDSLPLSSFPLTSLPE
jgi:hypothetical protein